MSPFEVCIVGLGFLFFTLSWLTCEFFVDFLSKFLEILGKINENLPNPQSDVSGEGKC